MGENVKEIGLKEIAVSGFNPRKHFDEEKLNELAASVKEKGVIEPLIVRAVNGKYEIVCGERRFKATQKASLETVPVIIKELTDIQAMEFQVIENLQREDLNPIDEALGYKLMLVKCGYKQAELAEKVGKKQGYIANRLRLLVLNKDIQNSISRGIISPGHAMVILRIKDPKARQELFKQVVNQKWSVHRAENELSDFARNLSEVPFDMTECKQCMFLGDNQQDLIDKDTKLRRMCLDPACFMRKAQAFIQAKRDRLKKRGFNVLTEKQLSGKGIDRYSAHDLGDSYTRKRIGAVHKTKCLANCPHHYYVIRTKDYGSEKGLQRIEEWCANSVCRNKLMYPKLADSSESNEGRQERQNQGKVRETKRRVWIEQATERLTDQAATSMVLHHLLRHHATYDGDILYELGLSKKKGEEYWDLGDKLFARILKMDGCKMVSGIRRLVVVEDIRSYGDLELDTLALHLGFDIGKGFVIDEEYLKTRTKDQLVAIAKEIKLKPEISASMKKTEMIEGFLKKGFDLKGKVPNEIKKKNKEE